MLYLRMLLSMVVGFYTSRVVLQTLGVIDYGIYGLVGGIISMLGFLNSSLSSASSQFITFELGTGDNITLQKFFNAAFHAHCLIAFLILLFAESVGFWVLNNYLVIPEDRIVAANIVYQLSLFSALISILQVPYSAVIIAHEQMDLFAWLEILNVTMKLAIVWLIRILPFEPILSYGVLLLLVSFTIFGIYTLYCNHRFPETTLSWGWHPDQFRTLMSFSGWNLYADATVTIRQQGINFLINRFFGVLLNASCAIASMVQGAVWLCGNNILTAFRPQIVKQFAVRNIPEMQRMMGLALQYTLIFAVAFTVPTILCMPFLLHIWLVEVPVYSIFFCRILLLDNLIGLVNHIVTIGIYAQGQIRLFSLINGTIKLFCLPAIYLLLFFHPTPEVPYLLCLAVLPFIIVINLYLLRVSVASINLRTILGYIIRPTIIALFSAIVVLPMLKLLDQGFIQFASITLVYFILLAIGCYVWLFDASSRSWAKRQLVCLLK